MNNTWKTRLLLVAVIASLNLFFLNADFVTPASMVSHSADGTTEAIGEVLVLHEDGFQTHHSSRYRHLLQTSEGSVELKFTGKVPHLHSGMKLHVRGQQSGNTLTLDSSSVENLGGGSAAASSVNTLGEQKTLVLLVNFQDNTSQPVTAAYISDILFTQANNFYKENSQQRTWFSGAVYGWYTLPLSQTSCDMTQIENSAKQAAVNAGIDLSLYSHYIFWFPNTAACPWGGAGTVGASPGRVWINGDTRAYPFVHELGHNLGLAHSHGLECGAASMGTNCTKIDYGDPLDVMGSTNLGHFNAAQKELLGWLNNLGFPPITTVQTSGTYTMSAYEAADLNTKALKILKSTDPTTGAKTWYYVEYRTPIGFDSFITSLTGTNVPNGVVVHTGTEGGVGNSILLDMTPASSPSYTYDWNDPALPVGRTYTDPDAGLTITTNAVNGNSATVTVNIGAPTTNCGRANPVLSASPQSLSGSPGTFLTYTLTVTNMDNSSCGSSNFVLQVVHTTGWDENFGVGYLSIAPGASASTTLAVRSPSSATGSTVISFTATNSAAPSNVASGSVTYQVVSGPQVSVTTDKLVYSSGQTVTISASVKSGSSPVNGAKVTFAITQPNGSVTNLSATTNASGIASASYRLGRKNVGGTYRVDATATSGGLSGTGSTQFSVQ